MSWLIVPRRPLRCNIARLDGSDWRYCTRPTPADNSGTRPRYSHTAHDLKSLPSSMSRCTQHNDYSTINITLTTGGGRAHPMLLLWAYRPSLRHCDSAIPTPIRCHHAHYRSLSSNSLRARPTSSGSSHRRIVVRARTSAVAIITRFPSELLNSLSPSLP